MCGSSTKKEGREGRMTVPLRRAVPLRPRLAAPEEMILRERRKI
ncbi:MAG: hypothetical protein WC483_03560 [Candidatus Paceibacterota bacterium]